MKHYTSTNIFLICIITSIITILAGLREVLAEKIGREASVTIISNTGSKRSPEVKVSYKDKLYTLSISKDEKDAYTIGATACAIYYAPLDYMIWSNSKSSSTLFIISAILFIVPILFSLIPEKSPSL